MRSEELVRHRRQLFSMAVRLCKNRDRAEDIVQVTLVKAFVSIGDVRPGANPVPWLCKILYRVWLDEKRRWSREPVVQWPQTPLEQDVEFCDPGRTPEEELLKDHVRADLLAFVGGLKRDDRRLIEMDAEGFEIAEIAKATGRPEGTVKSRLYRLRLKGQKQIAAGRDR